MKLTRYLLPLLVTLPLLHTALATEQKVTPSETTVQSSSGETVEFSLNYEAQNAKLAGLGLSLYFNHAELEFLGFPYCLKNGKVGSDKTANEDKKDKDKNPKTDRFVNVAWLSVDSEWPGDEVAQPLALCSVKFKVNKNFKGEAQVSLKGEAAEGETFVGHNVKITVH